MKKLEDAQDVTTGSMDSINTITMAAILWVSVEMNQIARTEARTLNGEQWIELRVTNSKPMEGYSRDTTPYIEKPMAVLVVIFII